MSESRLEKSAAGAAVGVAVLSVLYAISYLVITPSAQRGSNTTRALRSYLNDPTGLRIAAACLFVSGLLIPLVWVALANRLSGKAPTAASLVRLLGVVAGLATAAHGLGDLLSFDKLARTFAHSDAAGQAAVRVNATLPSSVDPRGLFTFGVAGAAVLATGLILRATSRRLGLLGIVLGADMLVLFLATAVGISGLILATGAIASVLLGPAWWVLIGRSLTQPDTSRAPSDPRELSVDLREAITR